MSLSDKLRGLLGRDATPRIRVQVFLRGRIGLGWQNIDRTFTLAEGSTLGRLLDEAEREGIFLRQAIAESPHLRHTLMLNGERCPLDENEQRVLQDGDQLYLLAPIAGG
ncbi:MAG TPA: MoaD/ThiS family protein [Polyangia bacterium]|jgi:sulfur carrier protein ThiS|nr:MoaD/ThiS family protein [Polyangia bacterium]